MMPLLRNEHFLPLSTRVLPISYKDCRTGWIGSQRTNSFIRRLLRRVLLLEGARLPRDSARKQKSKRRRRPSPPPPIHRRLEARDAAGRSPRHCPASVLREMRSPTPKRPCPFSG